MIRSFNNAETERLFRTESSSRFSGIARVALRKLIQLNNARTLADLAVPPGNKLEPLKGRWAGLHSIRVNDQWRIVFRWQKGAPAEVAIVDYH